MNLSLPSVSDQLSLNETITRLSQSPLVDGIAEFGSHTADHFSPSSDYDLLILVTHVPLRVFQLLTTIQGRLADIVLVETETADTVLATGKPPTTLFETLFVRKLQTAHIRFDRSDRLHRLQQLITSPSWQAAATPVTPRSAWPAIWFWQSFGLLQLERMAHAQDLVHLLAVDMLFTACLSGTWRSYFDIRARPWEGEKAALRYWMEHDVAYFQTVQACLGATHRDERLIAYRALVQQTIQPIGDILGIGETALVLAQAERKDTEVQMMLRYWNSLFLS